MNISWPGTTSHNNKNKTVRPSSVIRYSSNVPSEETKDTHPVRFNILLPSKQASRKSRRKRERERFAGTKKVSGFGGSELVRSNINGTILGTAAERPKTATLKRPSILDESLKDKVNLNSYLSCILFIL